MDESAVMHVWTILKKATLILAMICMAHPCFAIRNAQISDFDLDGLCSNIPTPHTNTTLEIFQSFIGRLKNYIASIGTIKAYRKPTNLTSIPKYWYALPESTDPMRVASTPLLTGFTPAEWIPLKPMAFSYQIGTTQGAEPVITLEHKMSTATQQAAIIAAIENWLSTLTSDKIEPSNLITLFQAGHVCTMRMYDPLGLDLDYSSMMDFWVLFNSVP